MSASPRRPIDPDLRKLREMAVCLALLGSLAVALTSRAANDPSVSGSQADSTSSWAQDDDEEDKTSAGYDEDDDEEEEDSRPIEELLQSEIVYVQEKGEFQVTVSPVWRAAGEQDRFQVQTEFEYGLTSAWEVDLEWQPYSRRSPETGPSVEGLGDVGVGIKHASMNVRENLHVAFGLEVGLPTGDLDKGLTDGFIEYEPFLVVARDFPNHHNIQAFVNIGFEILQRAREEEEDPGGGEEEAAAHEFLLNFGFFIPGRRLTGVFEINAASNEWNRDGDERELYVTPGLVWRLPLEGRWELAVGVPIGLNEDADDHRVIVMMTAEFFD